FWSTTSPSAADQNRCTTFHAGTLCHLSGYLYRPDTGTSNFPAILYVHGSGQTRSQSTQCQIVDYLRSRGYVVFAPTTRGVAATPYGKSPSLGNAPDRAGFQNTGETVTVWADDHNVSGTAEEREILRISYLLQEVSDLQLALDYLT